VESCSTRYGGTSILTSKHLTLRPRRIATRHGSGISRMTEEVVLLLVEYQEKQPERYPYVFLPPKRYDRIQQNRQQGKWTMRHGKCPVNNFNRQFNAILAHAKVDKVQFHDLRRTCLTSWLASGLSEYEAMYLAGHAAFETTRQFYLSVREDLLQRARAASAEALNGDFVAHPISGVERA